MNRPSPLFGRRSLALAGASFALTSLAMLSAGGGAPAQAQALANHDSSAPVDMAADRIEVQDRADRVIVSGDVRVTQAGMTLTAPRMTIASTRAGRTDLNPLDAPGRAPVTKGHEGGERNVRNYDLNQRRHN